MKFKTLACLSPAFQIWQGNSALVNPSPSCFSRGPVPALCGAVAAAEGVEMVLVHPGWEGLLGCCRELSAPEINRAHSCTDRAQSFPSAGGDCTAQQAPFPEHNNNIPVVSLVFTELLLQVSSLNSASDKSEGTCL